MTTLFPLTDHQRIEDFTPNDYETPQDIARKMAALLTKDDRQILEPCAGRGAIAREIKGRSVWAIELKQNRVKDGRILAPDVNWERANFLVKRPRQTFDVVITNPPFDLGIEIIERSLLWLNPNNPNARLLLLLLGDFFAAQGRCDRFEALNCHISHRWRIRGRVAYVREGVAIEGRQISDCVYSIKLGKSGATETVL